MHADMPRLGRRGNIRDVGTAFLCAAGGWLRRNDALHKNARELCIQALQKAPLSAYVRVKFSTGLFLLPSPGELGQHFSSSQSAGHF